MKQLLNLTKSLIVKFDYFKLVRFISFLFIYFKKNLLRLSYNICIYIYIYVFYVPLKQHVYSFLRLIILFINFYISWFKRKKALYFIIVSVSKRMTPILSLYNNLYLHSKKSYEISLSIPKYIV